MKEKDVKGLLEAYASVYKNISESHFKVGDEVKSKSNGMEGKVVKVDPEGKGKYYTVKHKDGKTMKHSPDDLKLDKEEEEGASKEKETEFHDKLDKMVHKTFGKRKEEKAMKEHKEETELFDYLLEYLVAEGYADTNKAALVIMANMSEEWRQSIVEQMTGGPTDSPSDEKKSFTGEGPKKPKGWKPTGPKLKSGQRPGYAR
jgi:hypothetical protein